MRGRRRREKTSPGHLPTCHLEFGPGKGGRFRLFFFPLALPLPRFPLPYLPVFLACPISATLVVWWLFLPVPQVMPYPLLPALVSAILHDWRRGMIQDCSCVSSPSPYLCSAPTSSSPLPCLHTLVPYPQTIPPPHGATTDPCLIPHLPLPCLPLPVDYSSLLPCPLQVALPDGMGSPHCPYFPPPWVPFLTCIPLPTLFCLPPGLCPTTCPHLSPRCLVPYYLFWTACQFTACCSVILPLPTTFCPFPCLLPLIHLSQPCPSIPMPGLPTTRLHVCLLPHYLPILHISLPYYLKHLWGLCALFMGGMLPSVVGICLAFLYISIGPLQWVPAYPTVFTLFSPHLPTPCYYAPRIPRCLPCPSLPHYCSSVLLLVSPDCPACPLACLPCLPAFFYLPCPISHALPLAS